VAPTGTAHISSPHPTDDGEVVPPRDLDAALRARFDVARAAWPGLSLEPEAFARHHVERAVGTELPALERSADLYLACACERGVPSAIQTFHVTYRDDIARAAARIHSSPSFADDLMQVVSERLFVPAGPARPRPRIAEYAGRASLRGWVGSVAKRAGLNMLRGMDQKEQETLSSSVERHLVVTGPEMALLKARYKSEFESAIRAAVGKLTTKDRTLLLLHFLEGVTLPQLATMQGVSRATIGRWLAAAREALHEETRRELLGRARLSPSELESVTALVRSQLELGFANAVRDAREKG
jgi:RNA polymerase sigma-70 factor (ECF subfamily)